MKKLLLLTILCVLASCRRADVGLITLESLLDEMTDPYAASQWSESDYRCLQTSSHDRSSVRPGEPEWFANADGFGYERLDTVAGRVEKVLFEDMHPGAITRIWITTHTPDAVVRFYFDGSETPGWVMNAYDFTEFGLKELENNPLLLKHTSYEKGVKGGQTFFLPIPYSRSLKVTLEDHYADVPRYYQFNYRRYPDDARVESFSAEVAARASKKIISTGRELSSPMHPKGRRTAAAAVLGCGDSLKLCLPKGERAVREIRFDIDVPENASYAQVMRELIFTASFDGTRCVNVPLSDFTAGGLGAPEVRCRQFESDGNGHFTSLWVMPYSTDAELNLTNISECSVPVKISARTERHKFTANTMYFHSSWRNGDALPLTPDPAKCSEWTFALLTGKGNYVGDVLTLFNHAPAWYGEGDEKIYVDGEEFPSHFGTGTEDYYNSSWAPVVVFQTPFGGAPRADQESSHGYNTFFRTRLLDNIPFRKSLKFDMELISWVSGTADYAVTVYWYGTADSGTELSSDPFSDRYVLPPVPADPAKWSLGGIEFENTPVHSKSCGLMTDRQGMTGFPDGKWSGGRQLSCFGGQPGDSISFIFNGMEDGDYEIVLHATKARDYGTVAYFLDGKKAAEFDGYDGRVTNSGPISLGKHEIAGGKLRFDVRIVGRNPLSSGYMFGLDCIVMNAVGTLDGGNDVSGDGYTLLLPVSDSSPEQSVHRTNAAGERGIPMKIRLAENGYDYFVPVEMQRGEALEVTGMPFGSGFWKNAHAGDASSCNVRGRVSCHFAPPYGWINDPNGMFFLDGKWHLFYQYNPYGAKWQNMSWGHAVSENLIDWEYLPVALFPDELGAIFSGSAVVDRCSSAGFSSDAVIAVYTSAGSRQAQSIAVSTDGGRTFDKYADNPVLVSSRPDFRDPKVFRHEPTGRWVMVVAAGDAMEIYSSADLKDWRFESRFGEAVGCHAGCWECPDLVELPYGDGTKWVILCSLDRGGEHGSAVQYFVGDFDGKKFRFAEDGAYGWLDHGRDFYAAVTWNNAPDGRRILLAWENNWRYANDLPLTGWRGQMSLPRELALVNYDGRQTLAALPVQEFSSALVRETGCGRTVDGGNDFTTDIGRGGRFIRLSFDGAASEYGVIMSNASGENVTMTFAPGSGQFLFDRTESGRTDFSPSFPCVTSMAVNGGRSHTLDVCLTRNSVECFVDGALSMTNLVFPASGYDRMTLFAKDAPVSVNAEIFRLPGNDIL